ncbi:MAG: hypothetical protein RL685_815 [Pseudomonadota bacterium]|jgi:hypothetical protein
MHFRRLTISFVLPFVFAACSEDGDNGSDVRVVSQQSGAGAEVGGGAAGSEGMPVAEPVAFNCVLPDLPEPQDLSYLNEKLPDPFTFLDGTKVTTKEQWDCRRKEILAIAAKYLYAPVPPAPDTVTGTVDGGAITIAVTVGGTTADFTATVAGEGDAIVVGGNLPGGNRTLAFGAGFQGQIQALFGFSELNPNIARGWMIDRVMDVLEQNPGSGLDPQRLVVTGCSGCGKGSLLTAAFSRVPVVVILESGGGGATSFRQVEWFRNGEGQSTWTCPDGPPQGIDNLEDNGACGPWVTSAARFFRDNPERVSSLPMDQHLLLATIAPRYVVHFTNDNGNGWCHLAGTSEALAAYAAKPVWNALGVPERMGFSMYSANHCGASAEQTALIGEMLKLAFNGDTSANTNVLNILPNGVQQPVSEWNDMWIDWDMQTLLQ